MKIYTKTGDTGHTSLIGGTRVSKASLRIEAYGTIDELNSYIGLVRDQPVNKHRKEVLKEIQDRLFTIGSHLAAENSQHKRTLPDIHADDVVSLEQQIDQMTANLPPLRAFILPGGHSSVSFCHIARTVCRRAERLVVALNDSESVPVLIVQYINRLSDFLFVLCRQMASDLSIEEVTWTPRNA